MKSGFTWRRGVEEDSEEPSDLEQDQAAKANPRPPKKQRTADGLSGSATQPGSAKGGNGAAAAFCLRCVRYMSNRTFGENPSLKRPYGGPPPYPACGQKKGSDNVIEDHITLNLEGPVAPVSGKAKCQNLRASASKHNTSRDIRSSSNVFTKLQGSYADYVTQFKSACLANNQLLHDKTIREAAKHFRSVKGAQRSRDLCQARLNEASTALQKLIRPALPQGSIPGPSYTSA
ncbi:hypothetical protein J3E69DRAFT_367257 [Trichoderma sp. SZMC 28015]